MEPITPANSPWLSPRRCVGISADPLKSAFISA
jgi:hypothetical protein